MLSFRPNIPVKIFSKSAGNNPDVWGVDIQGRRGYVPKKMIREERVHIHTTLLIEVPTEVAAPNEPPKEVKITETIVEQYKQEEDPSISTDDSKKEELPEKTVEKVEETSETIHVEIPIVEKLTIDPYTENSIVKGESELNTPSFVESTAPTHSTSEKPQPVPSEEVNSVSSTVNETGDSKPSNSEPNTVNPDNQPETNTATEEESISSGEDEDDDNADDSEENEEDENDYDEEKEYAGRVPVNEPPFIKKTAYQTEDGQEKSKDEPVVTLELIGLNNEELFTDKNPISVENKIDTSEKNTAEKIVGSTLTVTPTEDLRSPIDVVDEVSTSLPVIEKPAEENLNDTILKKAQMPEQTPSSTGVNVLIPKTNESSPLDISVDKEINENRASTGDEKSVTQLETEKQFDNSNEISETIPQDAETQNSTIENVKIDDSPTKETILDNKIDTLSAEFDPEANTTAIETEKNQLNDTSTAIEHNEKSRGESSVDEASTQPTYADYLSPTFLANNIKGVSAEVSMNVPQELNKEAEEFVKQNIDKIPEGDIVPLQQQQQQPDVSDPQEPKKEEAITENIVEAQPKADTPNLVIEDHLRDEQEEPEVIGSTPETILMGEQTTVTDNFKEPPAQVPEYLPPSPIDIDTPPTTQIPSTAAVTEDIWAYTPTESPPIEENTTPSAPWYEGILVPASDIYDMVYSKVESFISRSDSATEHIKNEPVVSSSEHQSQGNLNFKWYK